MGRKKIAIILSRFPYPLDKGDKLRAFHQINYIARFYDIYLYCLSDEEVKTADLEQLTPLCKEISVQRLQKATILVQMIRALLTGIPVQVGYFYSPKIKHQFQQAILDLKPDIVYCQLSRTAYYGKDLPFKKMIDLQDAFSTNYDRIQTSFRGLKKWFYKREGQCMKLFEKKMTVWFDACTIISAFDKEKIDCDPSCISVVSNGVDSIFFQPTKTEKKYDLLFSGNLSYLPNKNAVQFLAEKIAPKLVALKPGIRIHIAGASGDELKKYETTNLHVSGWLNDIREAYNETTLFVAPLFTGAGLQNKLLEAMSMGVPCIITPVTNASLLATENKHVLIANDADDFVQKIMKLLDDVSLQHQLSSNARKFIETNYTWNQANSILVSLFE